LKKSISTARMCRMSKELLDLTLDGWERSIFFDASKLLEECGEVAECLNKTSKTSEDLGDELADVIAVCFVIALKKGIDMDTAILRKQEERVKKLVKRFHGGTYPVKKEG